MVNKDFFSALADLEREKGISEEAFFDTLASALSSAYKKQYEGETGVVKIESDPEKGTLRFFLTHLVVDAEEAQEGEITLEDAKLIKKSAKVGDMLSEEFIPKDFTRIAAQTAKQVIQQKIRETERDNTLSEFSDKEGELMSREYDELNARLREVEHPMIYNYVDYNMPEWARGTIEKLRRKGALQGNENGELELTDDLLRMLVINDRMGLYGE